MGKIKDTYKTTRKQLGSESLCGARIMNRDLVDKGGTEVRALASHQCDPCSNSGVDDICGLSLLLVLSFSLRGFSPGTPVFPIPIQLETRYIKDHLSRSATSKSLSIICLI